MGPTNKALLNLFRADSALRQAQAKLDAATRGVRVQRKRAELAAGHHAETAQKLKRARAQQMELESDLKSRDAHIEHLREQQQSAENHKQFQAFLVEINNQKLDRGKVEEQAVNKLAEVEELQKLEAQQRDTANLEKQRAEQMQSDIGSRTTELTEEIERLQPLRDEAATHVPAAALAIFDKLADNYDGEAMAAVGHIEGKTEGYYCTSCNMELVVDIYNRLMTRDEVLSCTGCGRLLYVPEDLTPEMAVRQKKVKKAPRKKTTKASTKKGAKTQPDKKTLSANMRRVVTTAAAEALRQAELDEIAPVTAEVFLNGESAGSYRVKDALTLRRLINGKLQAEDMEADVAVKVEGDVEGDGGSQPAPVPESMPDLNPTAVAVSEQAGEASDLTGPGATPPNTRPAESADGIAPQPLDVEPEPSTAHEPRAVDVSAQSNNQS